MDWIYWAISQILLFWHSIWDRVLPKSAFLATNWEWILAIVFLVITVRVILFPLFVKQIKSQRAMQALQPQVKELQEKHKGDRETLQKELMELYRKEKANPLMGCLPLVLQIPVFFGLFHVLRRLNPERTDPKTTSYGWSFDQFHDASLAKLFAAPISESFSTGNAGVKVVAGVLVLIMIATTYLTSRQMILKTGWSEDPQQRMIQKLMLYGIPASLLISGFLYPFPIGVVIYWTTTNLFSLGQQFWVLRKYPPPKMNGKGGPATKAGAGTTGAPKAPRAGGAAGKGTVSAGKGGAGSGATAAGKAAAAAAGKGAASGKAAAKAAPSNGGESGRSGLFRRSKPAPPPAPPAAEPRSLAPKPGAKPVNPKKRGPKAKRPTG
ncbi:MAG TPA: membrane protein insertase YidC [Micromonosporaceae bacterium]|nr:membrane protein insertase YidC [Micromonosporaceae bacterium]